MSFFFNPPPPPPLSSPGAVPIAPPPLPCQTPTHFMCSVRRSACQAVNEAGAGASANHARVAARVHGPCSQRAGELPWWIISYCCSCTTERVMASFDRPRRMFIAVLHLKQHFSVSEVLRLVLGDQNCSRTRIQSSCASYMFQSSDVGWSKIDPPRLLQGQGSTRRWGRGGGRSH